MDENKNPQTEIIDENQLEDIAGGGLGNSKYCYFEPLVPFERKIEGNSVFVKCKSNCSGGIKFCHCHGLNNRCVDKWHVVERVSGDIWAPYPQGEAYHNGERKAIRGLTF